mmetsp:Transcript_11121/g.34092  ORF Transcript_11121/g.34092 Transcript_11121/m.34092 type:complete len:386 (-) Transcript_11121:1911-3068(-)
MSMVRTTKGEEMAQSNSVVRRAQAADDYSTTLSRLHTMLRKFDTTMRAILRANARQLVMAEEALRALALLAPGGDSELRAEGANTVLGLLAIYRDSMCEDEPLRKSAPVVLLAAIRASQVLMEITAERTVGRRQKFLPLFLTEVVKAALRLILLSRRGPGEPLQASDEKLRLAMPAHTCAKSKQIEALKGQRSGRMIITLSAVQNEEHMDRLFGKVYENHSTKSFGGLLQGHCEACSLEEQRNSSGQEDGSNGVHRNGTAGRRSSQASVFRATLAEVLYILRPVIFLCLVKRYRWKSWKPWSISLGVDLISLYLMSYKHPSERSRRTSNLLFYLARSPFFDKVSRSILLRVAQFLGRAPLVGGSLQASAELANRLQTYYFYTSAS